MSQHEPTDAARAQQSALDADLTAYYGAEARAGLRVDHGEHRRALRQRFADLLTAERRHRIVDVGAGPGLDTVLWRADGFDVIGLDLVEAHGVLMRSRGLDAAVGSLYELPFASGSFDALWTMSTFVHVPHDRGDAAIEELLRVVRPGAPLGIGTWGGLDFEGRSEFGEIQPYRFFSLASHDRWRATLERHGTVEAFETSTHPNHDWEYQFAIVRAPG